MRTPGKPDRSFAAGEPGAWNTQNRPVSSVIRCPDTFSSAMRFCTPPSRAAAPAAGGLGTRVSASDIWVLALLERFAGATEPLTRRIGWALQYTRHHYQ